MTNAEARFNKSLRPRKPEGSLGRTAQDVHLDSHTAPELWGQVDTTTKTLSLAGAAQVSFLWQQTPRHRRFSPHGSQDQLCTKLECVTTTCSSFCSLSLSLLIKNSFVRSFVLSLSLSLSLSEGEGGITYQYVMVQFYCNFFLSFFVVAVFVSVCCCLCACFFFVFFFMCLFLFYFYFYCKK